MQSIVNRREAIGGRHFTEISTFLSCLLPFVISSFINGAIILLSISLLLLLSSKTKTKTNKHNARMLAVQHSRMLIAREQISYNHYRDGVN